MTNHHSVGANCQRVGRRRRGASIGGKPQVGLKTRKSCLVEQNLPPWNSRSIRYSDAKAPKPRPSRAGPFVPKAMELKATGKSSDSNEPKVCKGKPDTRD
jgi:hypothetical protein